MRYLLSKIKFEHLLLIVLKFKVFLKFIKIIFSRVFLRFCSIGLKVPKWHLNATFESRAYKSQVIKISNMYKTNYVIEVGCGIGEILSRLNAPYKYGLDINMDTLLLCKRINKNIKTIQSDIIKNNRQILEIINSIEKDEFILIIMVNWLHEYSENKVKNMFEKILSINRKIIVIADIYQRKEFSKISHNKIVHKFDNINNKIFYKRINNIDKVRDLVILSNIDILD